MGVALTPLLAGCGDGQGDLIPDAGAPPPDVPGVVTDAPSPAPCALGGTGRLRVTVSIDPTLDHSRADIWLAARCGEGEQDRPVRVLRWNRESTQTFEGLGPGSYQVFASSFLSPGAWSSRVTLGAGTTAAVPVTLQGGASTLATLRTGGESPNAPSRDIAGIFVSSLAITTPTATAPIGRLDVSVTPATDGGLIVQSLIRNTCATQPCARFELQGIEVRTAAGEAPGDLSTLRVEPVVVRAGDVVPVRPMLVRGQAPDAAHTLEVAVFGTVLPAVRSAP